MIMESALVERLYKNMQEEIQCALAIITKTSGSTPGKNGFMMLIERDSFIGNLGGGRLEYEIIHRARIALDEGNNVNEHFSLNAEGDMNMICGGECEVFIKVFSYKPNLLIFGGGHIGKALYELATSIGFQVVVFDNREQICLEENFPKAQIIKGDFESTINNYHFSDCCFGVIVTHGHHFDKECLKLLLDKHLQYLGMIGSEKKCSDTIKALQEEGIGEELLEKIYAPIGIDLGGNSPEEIALSIISEITLIKNNGKLQHKKLAHKAR